MLFIKNIPKIIKDLNRGKVVYGRIHSFLVAIILMYKNMMNKMNDNDDGDEIEEADD